MTLPVNEAAPAIDEEGVGIGLISPTALDGNKRSRAMRDLAQLVGTSRKAYRQDIKRIRRAETLEGARKWAKEHSTAKRKYEAIADDPDEDGIEDVIVKAADGSLVIVNGYTLRNSDYPYRQMFGRLSEDVRKKYGNYKQFLTEEHYGAPTRDEKGRIVWPKLNPEEEPRYQLLKAKHFRTFKPREKTAYQTFTSEIVKPQIEALFYGDPRKYQIGVIRDADGTERPRFPNVLLAVAADAWNYGVLRPILEGDFKINVPDDIPPDSLKELCSDPQFATFKKKAEFREVTRTIVEAYRKEDYEKNGKFLNKYLNPMLERILTTADSLARPGGA